MFGGCCRVWENCLIIILYDIYKFIYHVTIMIFVDGIENVTNKKGELFDTDIHPF